MLNVSAEYKDAIKADQRYLAGVAILDFGPEIEYPIATATASTTYAGYSVNDIIDGRFRVSSEKFVGNYIPSELNTASQGWRGTKLSSVDGTLADPEVLTITYDSITCSNFWLVGTEDNFPVDFTIEVTHSLGTGLIASVTGNTEYIWSMHENIPYVDITQVVITITKISVLEDDNALVVEAGALTKVCFDKQDFVEMGGTEEVLAPNGGAIGNVSSNECFVKFYNENGLFVMSNTNSPFYGVMRPSIKIEVYIGVEILEDTFEMVPLGVFKTEDWNCSTVSNDFTISGYDRINEYSTVNAPTLLPCQNTTLNEYLDIINAAANLDATIDAARDSTPLFCYNKANTVLELLQTLALAIPGVVYVDRLNTLRIRPYDMETDATPVATWTDDDLIILANNPQQYGNNYSDITMTYYNISPMYNQEVLRLTDIEVSVYGVALDHLPLPFPILYVESITITRGVNVAIGTFTPGTMFIDMFLTNGGVAPETVDIVVTACVMKENPKQLNIPDTTYNLEYTRTLSVDIPLLQDTASCEDYASKLFSLVADPTSEISTEVRFDPAVELMDQVIIDDPSEDLNNIQIVVFRQEWEFNGALSAIVTGRKTS